MKTVEQIICFIEGWEQAIKTGDESLDDRNEVLQTLGKIWDYIHFPPFNP